MRLKLSRKGIAQEPVRNTLTERTILAGRLAQLSDRSEDDFVEEDFGVVRRSNSLLRTQGEKLLHPISRKGRTREQPPIRLSGHPRTLSALHRSYAVSVIG